MHGIFHLCLHHLCSFHRNSNNNNNNNNNNDNDNDNDNNNNNNNNNDDDDNDNSNIKYLAHLEAKMEGCTFSSPNDEAKRAKSTSNDPFVFIFAVLSFLEKRKYSNLS